MIDLVTTIDKIGSLDQTLDLIMQGSSVKRFHSVETIKDNPTSSHQWGVAMLVYLMSDGMQAGRRLNLVMAAITHDIAEKVFGDIPAPTKRRLGMREVIGDLEDSYLEANGLKFDLDFEQESILKLADIFDGMLFCVREHALGNMFIVNTYDVFKSYAENEIVMTGEQKIILQHIENLWEETYGRTRSKY